MAKTVDGMVLNKGQGGVVVWMWESQRVNASQTQMQQGRETETRDTTGQGGMIDGQDKTRQDKKRQEKETAEAPPWPAVGAEMRENGLTMRYDARTGTRHKAQSTRHQPHREQRPHGMARRMDETSE